MNCIADICVVPIGVGVSVSRHVAACENVFRDAGLSYQLHAYGTNVEGTWDDVVAAIRRCHEVVHEMGAPRISTTIRIGTRTDRDQTMAQKVASVQEKREGASG
ncbi:MAG TPA: MTH1187 family thiamine-binding protein [bacterium]|nr:MTH1187 family thiamine-binding protein [bacterium]